MRAYSSRIKKKMENIKRFLSHSLWIEIIFDSPPYDYSLWLHTKLNKKE